MFETVKEYSSLLRSRNLCRHATHLEARVRDDTNNGCIGDQEYNELCLNQNEIPLGPVLAVHLRDLYICMPYREFSYRSKIWQEPAIN